MKKYIIAVIVSNLFDILVSGILGGIISMIVFSSYNLDIKAIGQDPSIYTTFLSNHAGLHFLISSVGGVVSFLAGFVAAKIAKEKYLLFGGLSSIFCVISGIITMVQRGVTVLEIILIFLTPILGMLGGYIWKRSNQEYKRCFRG